MVSSQMNKHTTEKELKMYKGEMWETGEKH